MHNGQLSAFFVSECDSKIHTIEAIKFFDNCDD